MNDPALLTVRETSERLRLSRSTVYQLLLKNQIRSVVIGRATSMPASASSDFLARLEAEQAPQVPSTRTRP
jgi:excisionase family DNA binding protein